MTKDQKKLKQLTAENAELNAKNLDLFEANVSLECDLDREKDLTVYSGELVGKLTKQLNYSTNTIDKLSHERHAMNVKLQEVESIRQISAEGLIIERDELLVRARRLEMRIRGLGFDV